MRHAFASIAEPPPAAARHPLSRLAEPQVLFPLMALVLLGVVWGTTLNLIGVERRLASQAAAATTEDLAATYEAQVLRALREIDQTLKLLRFAHERAAAGTGLDALRRRDLLPPDLLFTVSIAGPDGRIVASTRPAGTRDVAGQDYFRRVRDDDVVAVGQPVEDAREGEPRLHFARRLETAGAFAGAAIVSVPAGYFVAGYEQEKLGAKGVLGLLGSDGVFRVRRTGDTLAFGERTDAAAALRGGESAAAGPLANPWDGERRYTIAREIFGFPLATVVGLAEDEQMAAVDARAADYRLRAAGGSVLIVLFVGALGLLAWRLGQTRLRANLALQEEIAIRRLAEADLNLRNRAIESSVNAILITDANGAGSAIEYVNPAFERITGYGAAEALGRSPAFLLGEERDQPAVLAIEQAMRERQDGHAVLRCYRRDGSLFWNEYFTAPVRNDAGEVTHFVGVMNDVTESKRYEEQLAHKANFDELTGLANRNLLQDRLRRAIAGARREGRSVAVAFLDIDHFKLVNDSIGHRVGDQLLCQVAGRLATCVRETDTVARMGGDEFVLVLGAIADGDATAFEASIGTIARKLLAGVSAPMTLEGRPLRPTASIGVSVFPRDGDDADTLLRNADAAMYRAKELGRNRVQFFTQEVQERIRSRMELETNLRLALERGEFELHYQPQVSLRTGAMTGIEALLRWRHPERGLVGPGSFIGFAEETGLIEPIGEWALREACRRNKSWQDAGLMRLPVAVNLSARQCEQENIERVVRQALSDSGLAPEYLELELTESLSMGRPEQSVPLMRRLRETGVSLSIDDFGTGFSNLGYLPRFPVDRLKIDLSFVRQMVNDPGSLAVSEAIINMSHSLNLQVVAEGVETRRQLELLGERQCDSIQGYLFSPPLPADQLARLLAEDRRLHEVLPTRVHPAPSQVM